MGFSCFFVLLQMYNNPVFTRSENFSMFFLLTRAHWFFVLSLGSDSAARHFSSLCDSKMVSISDFAITLHESLSRVQMIRAATKRLKRTELSTLSKSEWTDVVEEIVGDMREHWFIRYHYDDDNQWKKERAAYLAYLRAAKFAVYSLRIYKNPTRTGKRRRYYARL